MLSLHNDISTYTWLKSLYPSCITELKELDELLKVEAKVSDDFDNSVELVVNNKFIDTMDEKTVEEFEKFFGITISSDKSLDERRNIIKAYYCGHGKLTMGQLCNIVETIAGEGNCSGEFKAIDSTKNNYIILTIENCNIRDNIFDILQVLEIRIPSHLELIFQYIPYGVSLMQYSHIANNHTVNQSIGTVGVYSDYNSINKNNLLLFQNNSRINSIVAELPLIYGGNFLSYDDEEISGGDFNDYYSTETYDGNYLF